MEKPDSNRVTTAIALLNSAELSSSDVARIIEAAFENFGRFEPREVALCTGLLLDALRVIPLRDTMYLDEEGVMFVQGKPVVDGTVRKAIITGARQMLKNPTRKLVKEKIEYASHVMARNAVDTLELIFAKAALWFVQEEDKVYSQLVQQDGGSLPTEDDEYE